MAPGERPHLQSRQWDRPWHGDRRAVIWSKDVDFAERARQSPGLQVVWLRFGNTSNVTLRRRLTPLLGEIEAALAAGEILIEIR